MQMSLSLFLLFLFCVCVHAQQNHRWLYSKEYLTGDCSGDVHAIRGVRSGVCQTDLAFLSSLFAATGDALPANTASFRAELSPDHEYSWLLINVFSSSLCANDSLLAHTHVENVLLDDSTHLTRCRAHSSVPSHSFMLVAFKDDMHVSVSSSNTPPLSPPPIDKEDSLAHTPSTAPTVVPVDDAQAEREPEIDTPTKRERKLSSEASLAVMCVGATILLALHVFAFCFFCCRRGVNKVSSDDSVGDEEVSAMESQMRPSPVKSGSDDRVSVYAEG